MTANPDNATTAFAFPGIGVKLCGHEQGFYAAHAGVMKPFLDQASAFCGSDLAADLATHSGKRPDEYADQFFTYAFSAGMASVLAGHGVRPSIMAAYSFGIYGALHGSGAVNFEDGLRIIDAAYHILANATWRHNAGLGIVIGLTRAEINGMLADWALPSVVLVNTNNRTCHIFCGLRRELAALFEAAFSRDAIAADFLEVTIPYHHPLLAREVESGFTRFLDTVRFAVPAVPVLSPIDCAVCTDAASLRMVTARNLYTPINWHAAAAAMHGRGVATVIECGPGISLTQNGRFMEFRMRYVNVKNYGVRIDG